MQNNFTSLVRIATCAVLALGAAAQSQAADAAKKVDANGSWTTTQPGRNGGPDRVTTFKLKVEGDKVTGSVSAPGRGGAAAADVAISDGKIKGDEISFSVVRDMGGTSMTTKYNGKIDGDTIKGKVERPSRDGSPATPADWEAKRAPATPPAEKK
jgi:hypothetical protein